MTGLLHFWNLKAARKSAVALLALLLVLLAVSFLPFGANSGSGNEKSRLMFQLQELDSLPPAVDVKIEPAVKEDIKEALYLAAAAKTGREREEKGKVEVLVKASSADAGKDIRNAGGEILNTVDSVDRSAKYFAVEVDADKVAAIAADNDVSSISQRGVVYPTLDSSVPVIKADAFWNAGYKGGGVKVAVLDTGIDKSHPMLKGKVVAERDFTSSGSAADECGHGTHVAGIVAGSKADGGLYDGVAPGAQLMNAKVLTLGPSGTCKGKVDFIIAAIGWALDPDRNPATDDGAKVISMSLGGVGETSASLENELKAAVANGTVVVVSSGNCGSGCPGFDCGSFRGVTWPGNSPSVITVGAVDDAKDVACFSSGENVQNVGIKPDFTAPGVDVASSVPNSGYESKKGTSMAAPHVSGSVALMLGKSPGIRQADVVRILEKTALDRGDIGKDTSYGYGVIDLAKALAYKEGLEVSVELETPVISGSAQKITVRVYDDVTVNSVKATITKPNTAKSDVTFTGTGSNVYAYDYTDTALMGNYVVDVAVNYGGGGGSSGAGSEGGGEAGSGTGDSSSITATGTAYFKVTSLTGDFGNVEGINISQQQRLSSNLTGTLTFANTAGIELNFSALLQLLDNGTLAQEIRLPAVTVAAGLKAAAAINNLLDVSPGNYTLRVLTDYGAGSLVNETNITVSDDLAPQILKIDYGKSIKARDAQTIIVEVNEHQRVQAALQLSQGSAASIKPITVNYTTKIVSDFGSRKTIALTIFNGSDNFGADALNEGSGYVATLQLCDESGNCYGDLGSGKKDAEFSITACSGKSVLAVKTYDSVSVFEEAAASGSGVCLSQLNKSVSGTPPASYLERFDAVVWSAGTDLANIDGSDAAVLAGYYGKKGKVIVEGSDVAFRHGSDSFMRDVLHSELKTDLGFTVTSVANMSSLGINVTRQHPVVAGLGSSMFFNTTIDPFPDAVQPYNGSVELAEWSGLETKGSAVVAYESDDGAKKSLLLPFSVGALNATAARTLAANVLGWLLEDASADIGPIAISHGVLVDGQPATIGIGVSATGSQWSPVRPRITALVDDVVVSQGEVDMPSAGLYQYNFTAALKAGRHTLKVVSNSNFSVKESNYANSVKEYSVAVYPKDADLLLTGFSYSYNDSSGTIVALLNVSNFGGAAASSALKAYLDGKEAAGASVALSAGETKQVALGLPSQRGVFQFKAVADPDNSVAEHNESNNELQQKVYICSKEKILVVDDNDAAFFSTPDPSSSDEFIDVLRNAGYCVEPWDEKQQGVPGSSELGKFASVVWAAGDYFNGTISNEDAIAIGNYTGGLLIEGSDVGLDNAGSSFLQSIAAAAFSSDMLLNESENESLVLKNHSITENITSLSISREKSPYPDSIEAEAVNVVAEWQGGKAAIAANTGSGRKTAYYAFSVDGITDAAAMDKLITNTVGWLLVKPNSPPRLQNFTGATAEGTGAAAIMNEGDTRNFSVAATDADNDTLTYEWLLNSTVASATNYFAFSPKYNESGDYNLTAIVSDGQAEARTEIIVTVLDTMECDAGKQAKLCQLQQGVCGGSNVTCNATGKWPACTAATYLSYSINYEPVESLCDGLDNNCNGQADENRVCNRAPALQAVGNRTIQENSTLSFTIAATDADGDALAFSAVPLPQGAGFSNTGAFAWAPGFDQSGVYAVTFTASDGIASANQTVNLTVVNVNRAPVVNIVVEPAGLSVDEGSFKLLKADASDPDGDSLEYEWLYLGNAEWQLQGKEDLVSKLGFYKFAPSYTDGDSYNVYKFMLKVSDGSAAVNASVDLAVVNTQDCLPETAESAVCGSNVGTCKQGTKGRVCGVDYKWGSWGGCVGEVKPLLKDDCGTLEDENCDSQANEGCRPDLAAGWLSWKLYDYGSGEVGMFSLGNASFTMRPYLYGEVLNVGVDDAPPSLAAWYLNSRFAVRASLPRINSGQKVSVNFMLPYAPYEGANNVSLIADANSKIKEGNKANNQLDLPISVTYNETYQQLAKQYGEDYYMQHPTQEQCETQGKCWG